MDLFDTFLDSGALNHLLSTNDSKNSFKQKLYKIGENNRQIDPLTLYLIAAKSVPDSNWRSRMLSFLRQSNVNLEKAAWPMFIGQITSLALYYSGISNVLTQDQFSIFAISALNAIQKLNYLPHIRNWTERGACTLKFVNAILNGKKPHKAIEIALSNKNLREIIRSPFANNNYNSAKNNNNSKKWYTSRNTSGNRTFYKRQNKSEFITCRVCGHSIKNNKIAINDHNNNYCQRELPKRT